MLRVPTSGSSLREFRRSLRRAAQPCDAAPSPRARPFEPQSVQPSVTCRVSMFVQCLCMFNVCQIFRTLCTVCVSWVTGCFISWLKTVSLCEFSRKSIIVLFLCDHFHGSSEPGLIETSIELSTQKLTKWHLRQKLLSVNNLQGYNKRWKHYGCKWRTKSTR